MCVEGVDQIDGERRGNEAGDKANEDIHEAEADVVQLFKCRGYGRGELRMKVGKYVQNN